MVALPDPSKMTIKIHNYKILVKPYVQIKLNYSCNNIKHGL